MRAPTPNDHLVCVLYYPKYLKSSQTYIRYLQKQIAHLKVYIVINGDLIKDSDIDDDLRKSEMVVMVRHDNVGLEFGAYQRGLNLIEKTNLRSVVFFNDTVGRHDPFGSFYLSEFAREIQRGVGQRRAIGKVDTRERKVSIKQLSGSRWLRTNFFALDYQALDALNFQIFDPGVSELIRGGGDVRSFYSDALDAELADDISQWLFGNSGLRWYGAAKLTEENSRRMTLKARSILQEWYLSLRLDNDAVAFGSPKLNRRGKLLDRFLICLPWSLRPLL